MSLSLNVFPCPVLIYSRVRGRVYPYNLYYKQWCQHWTLRTHREIFAEQLWQPPAPHFDYSTCELCYSSYACQPWRWPTLPLYRGAAVNWSTPTEVFCLLTCAYSQLTDSLWWYNHIQCVHQTVKTDSNLTESELVLTSVISSKTIHLSIGLRNR